MTSFKSLKQSLICNKHLFKYTYLSHLLAIALTEEICCLDSFFTIFCRKSFKIFGTFNKAYPKNIPM